jgi:hypothetical protein
VRKLKNYPGYMSEVEAGILTATVGLSPVEMPDIRDGNSHGLI